MQRERQKLLIVGLGDVARRALPELLNDWEVTALTRSIYQDLDDAVHVCEIDLDAPIWTAEQLNIIQAEYDAVLWTAPPVLLGTDSHYPCRMQRLLDVWREKIDKRGVCSAQRWVYISTSGVYGDRQGAWVDELAPVQPQSARARARVADELICLGLSQLLNAQLDVTILRAPGIYALERLPIGAVMAGSPVMCSNEDSFSNHIHADDLAGALAYALNRPLSPDGEVTVLNVCDDEPVLMGQWMGALAQALGMPAPECISRADMARTVSAQRWSFMCESRRLSNQRLHNWGYKLRYPFALAFVHAHAQEIRAQTLESHHA